MQLFNISMAESLTEWITSYSIHPSCGSRLDYTLNIVDMPGFGDTRGIDYDERTVRQLRHLFTSSSADGLSHVDAVCFLLKASDGKLTPTQKYIFDSILSVFGKDISKNIFLMVTFADSKSPEAMKAIRGIENLKHSTPFLFNNCSLYSCNEDLDDYSYYFWRKTMEGFDAFFDNLCKVQTKSLKMSAEVLLQRDKIENTVLQLQEQVEIALTTIGKLEKEIYIFKKHKKEIKDNKNFEYEIEEIQFVKEDISGQGIHTTTCLACNYTCHNDCIYPNDEDKKKCMAMNSLGTCRFCPGKCEWNVHSNVPFVIRRIPKKVKKTYAEMEKSYAQAEKKKMSQEEIIARIGEDILKLENGIEEKLEVIAQCNNILKEIALNPNPLSTAEYIELMIESEKREKKPGFDQRIQALEKCLKRVKIEETIDGARERINKMRNIDELAELNINDQGWFQKLLGAVKKPFTKLK